MPEIATLNKVNNQIISLQGNLLSLQERSVSDKDMLDKALAEEGIKDSDEAKKNFVSKSETVLQSGIENIKISENAFAIVSTIMVGIFVLIMGIIAYFLYRALPRSENNDIDTMIDITKKTSFINYVPIAIVFIMFIVINYRFLFLY